MQHKFLATAGLASLSLFLSACSDEDEPLTPNATSSGLVSGFGSVYVNGVRYVTQDSNVISNGNVSSEEAIKVGMKLRINAHQSPGNDATAFDMEYLSDAIGEIEAIDLAAPSITVLGQDYLITSATKFDDVPFDKLTVGMGVEISALENEKGSFVVGYLASKNDLSEYQLFGTISKLNKIEKTYSIGKLLVNYADADLQGTLSNGSKVAVKSDIAPINNELIADEVTVRGLVLVIGGTLTYSGFIESIDVSNDEGTTIGLGGRKYLLTDTTDITQGSEDDLQLGSQVSVIATVIEGESEVVSPTYPVNSIRVELDNEVSLEGIVQSITDTSFTIFGQEFSVDSYTQYEDDSDQDLRYFTFSDIAIGDKLDIDAYEVNGLLISRKVEREETGASEQGTHDIEGIVDDIDHELVSFSVKGITILTDAETMFENSQGNTVNQEVFFQTVATGDEVEVEVTYSGNAWLALEVEIDGEEADKEVELVGIIDNYTNRFSFSVNGHPVVTNMQTEYENGKAEDLANNVRVEVEGQINSEGQLVAEDIEFIDTEINE